MPSPFPGCPWLPMVSGIDAELFDACFRPLSQDPSTAAEFALFLRYYGVAEAAKLLQEQLRTRSDWDGWLLAEAGNMIVRLPLPEQREIGRRYTQMLFDLPARMFFEASTRNAFTTMMRLLGDHGIPYDRIRAMNLANEFFLFRVADGLPVTSNWVEAYLNLCNRALRQERYRLSLEVARHLVLDQGHPNHARGAGHFQEAYQRLLEKEARARFDGILRTGLNLLNDVTDFRRLLGEVNVPTNILRLVAAWGTPVQKSEIAALFVAYVEAVANKAPLDRMSAFLSSGFRLVGLSGSAELQRRFLAAILLWLLEHRALPESEQAKFAFYVLRQTVGGLFDDDLVARSRELLMKSIFDPSAGLAMWNGVLAHLCRLTNVPYAPSPRRRGHPFPTGARIS